MGLSPNLNELPKWWRGLGTEATPELYAALVEAFDGNNEALERWIGSINLALQLETPADRIRQGRGDTVWQLLARTPSKLREAAERALQEEGGDEFEP